MLKVHWEKLRLKPWQGDFWKYNYGGWWKKNVFLFMNTPRRRNGVLCYQIIVVLEGVVQGGDPLAVPIHQHVPLLPETRRLNRNVMNTLRLEGCTTVMHFNPLAENN